MNKNEKEYYNDVKEIVTALKSMAKSSEIAVKQNEEIIKLMKNEETTSSKD